MSILTPSRVLHVINSLALGGAERLVSSLLPYLPEQGFIPTLLVLDDRGDAFSDDLRSKGVGVVFARSGGASPYSPFRLGDVLRTVKAVRPDIVHAHLAPSFHWCAAAKGLGDTFGLVATEHASANRRMRMPLVRGIERAAYEKCDAVACVSQDAKAAIGTWLPTVADRLVTIPNGIDEASFNGVASAADVVKALAGRRGVAMTARFVPEKDHATAVRIAARLPSDTVFVFIGDGPGLPAARLLADELGAMDRILFLGARTDVAAVLSACQAFVLTSKIEGFGIAALEAMAAGLPVIAGAVAGLGPLVEGAGVLVQQGDDDAYARRILEVLKPGPERERIVAAGHERARSHSLAAAAARYGSLYRSIIERRHSWASR